MGKGDLTIVAMRQLPRGFLRMQAFFKNTWHLKDIFREFEVFLKDYDSF
jgi:hypothetical protein